jgi:ABC-type transport system involved in cytochrome bd biosynthesis fused ATPase/permease subunit
VLNADKILILDHGRIVASGSHSELLQTSPIYQDIYRSQFGTDQPHILPDTSHDLEQLNDA